jgi:hypothetical protein
MKSPFTKKQCLEAVSTINEELTKAVEQGYYFEYNITNFEKRMMDKDSLWFSEPTGEILITIKIDVNRKVEY